MLTLIDKSCFKCCWFCWSNWTRTTETRWNQNGTRYHSGTRYQTCTRRSMLLWLFVCGFIDIPGQEHQTGFWILDFSGLTSSGPAELVQNWIDSNSDIKRTAKLNWLKRTELGFKKNQSTKKRCLSNCLSVCLPGCLSVCLNDCLTVRLSVPLACLDQSIKPYLCSTFHTG